MSLFRWNKSSKANGKLTRLFFASDFHGSQRIFRKFINAAKHYEADVLVMGGDVVGKLANCASVSMVMVTGHTDRLGSQQYNQKLSEKRAEAVKTFLQQKGVPADKIDTMGAGKTQPAQGVKCEDKLPRKKLIECLAPSRRVVVEVKGTAK